MRAVLYARVSSAAQRDKHTIASQLRTLPEFIAARGWTLARPATHYVDDGRSAMAGKLEKREAFRRLLADAAARAFDVVVVIGMDRLTRAEDQGERGEILGTFFRAGVQVAVASTGQVLDLATSHGDLLSFLGAWSAADENRRRREATIRGKVEAARKGRKPSGPTLYGYRYDRTSGAWSIDEEAAPFVREAFERVAAGETCYAVCRDLSARGALRPRNGHWSRSRVWTLVTNHGYTGSLVVDRVRRIEIAVPALVSDELFDRAAAALRAIVRPPRSRHFSLLEGIARCGVCGGKIGITGRTNDSTRVHRYYMCRARPSCGLRMLPTPVVDARVWAELADVAARPDLAERGRAAARAEETGPDWAADLAGYERQLSALDRAEAAILERFRRGRISEAAMDRELEASARHRALLERSRDIARQGVANARLSRAEAEALIASLGGLRARMDAAGPQERQELARLLVPGTGGLQVTLWRDRAEIVGRLQRPAAAARPVPRPSVVSTNSEQPRDMMFRRVAAF